MSERPTPKPPSPKRLRRRPAGRGDSGYGVSDESLREEDSEQLLESEVDSEQGAARGPESEEPRPEAEAAGGSEGASYSREDDPRRREEAERIVRERDLASKKKREKSISPHRAGLEDIAEEDMASAEDQAAAAAAAAMEQAAKESFERLTKPQTEEERRRMSDLLKTPNYGLGQNWTLATLPEAIAYRWLEKVRFDIAEAEKRAQDAAAAAAAGGAVPRRGAAAGAAAGGPPAAAPPMQLPQQQVQNLGDPRISGSQLAVLGEFSGSATEDIMLFLIQVRRCRDAFQWSDAVTSQLVQTRLTGVASTWLVSLLKTAEPNMFVHRWSNNNFDEFGRPLPQSGLEQLLRRRFYQEINGRGAVESIVDLRQRSTESVDEFHDRVLIAMDRKNFRATLQEKETAEYRNRLRDDSYTWFAAGLQEDIRMAALGGVHPPQTLDDLLMAARNAETERKRARKGRTLGLSELADDSSAPGGDEERESADDIQLNELRNELDALKKKFNDFKCWECGQAGHMQRVCPSKSTNAISRGGNRRKKKRFVFKKKSSSSGATTTKKKKTRKLYAVVGDPEASGSDLEFEEVEVTVTGVDDDGQETWCWDPNSA